MQKFCLYNLYLSSLILLIVINRSNQIINQNNFYTNKTLVQALSTKFNFCDIDKSRLAVFIIEEIKNFIDKSNEGKIEKLNKKNNKCLIKNNKFTNFVNLFNELDDANNNSYGSFRY